MKARLPLICLIFALVAIPVISSASDWTVFTPKQKDGATWYYDKASITYPKNTSIIGITTWMRDVNYQKLWIRSTTDTVNLLYQVEMDCKARTARMLDNNGKGIYSMNNIDYLFDRPIPPDAMLDLLRKTICSN